jgi:5-(carboxyamino)imidazole ribonucleotide synthase
MLKPGSTLGILGGGQLGRMTALAAANLGYRCHIFCPEKDSPAAQVCDRLTLASYEDKAALDRFAGQVDVVTFEFENIPASPVRHLSDKVPVRPGARALEVAQDRLHEKRFFNDMGIATAPWREVRSEADLKQAAREIGLPAILKTTRFGYDGKGQVRLDSLADAGPAWAAICADVGVLEGFVRFDKEISVIAARGEDGTVLSYDVVENRHAHHILDTTTAPAPIAAQLAAMATDIAVKAAAELDLIGLLAVEMFLTEDGRILVNEMAPRPHNSGHWTMDACQTSQFEQLVRAVCGLPLGSPARHADAVMTNLIGEQAESWPALLAEPNAKLHLYGKTEIRAGRKMGHVTRLRPLSRP